MDRFNVDMDVEFDVDVYWRWRWQGAEKEPTYAILAIELTLEIHLAEQKRSYALYM